MRSGELPKGCSERGVDRYNIPDSKWQGGFTGLGVWVMRELWPEMLLHRSVHCAVMHASAAIIAIFPLSVKSELVFIVRSDPRHLSCQECACHSKGLMPLSRPLDERRTDVRPAACLQSGVSAPRAKYCHRGATVPGLVATSAARGTPAFGPLISKCGLIIGVPRST